MKVKIKRIDEGLPLPRYETDGSIGFDILAREKTSVPAGKIALIPGNIIVEVPVGYMLTIASRSSTPIKKGLLTPHGIGVIDHDYCGPEDEVKIQVYNFTDKDVTVERGDKVAQGLFVRVDKFAWEEITDVKRESRGGFGSTDK
jgi:dUTP pyrophosphatase